MYIYGNGTNRPWIQIETNEMRENTPKRIYTDICICFLSILNLPKKIKDIKKRKNEA